jgi:hypothetical protein
VAFATAARIAKRSGACEAHLAAHYIMAHQGASSFATVSAANGVGRASPLLSAVAGGAGGLLAGSGGAAAASYALPSASSAAGAAATATAAGGVGIPAIAVPSIPVTKASSLV